MLLPEQRHLLETFASQIALALERAAFGEEAATARVAAETESLRNTLLASISHDLRTPLAVITGAASTLTRHGAVLDQATQRGLAASIEEQAREMSNLISNVLDLMRLESGRIELQCEAHSLEDLVGTALHRIEVRLRDRPVDIDLPADLPDVQVDPILVTQVLTNLLDNAAKFTPPGTKIRIAAVADGRFVRVVVEDEGPGLPSGDPRLLFEKFQRGRDESAVVGAGLGLAICRAIVTAHGGDITAGPRARGGARFEFTLPSAPAATMTQAMHQILVIEDEPGIRAVLRVLLEAEKFRVIEAGTAERGEIEARTHKPDLLLVDLGLPDADGLAVVRRVRKWSTVPIVVLSARTMESQKIAALDAGADDYVTKPFSAPELLARVRAACAGRCAGLDRRRSWSSAPIVWI